MQNERSGARRQHKKDEVLSPTEAANRDRGLDLKRHVRAAAAMHGLYEDTAIATAVGVGRGTVLGWWRGSKPEPATLRHLAEVTGFDPEELATFVYWDGPPPRQPSGLAGLRLGAERGQKPPDDEAPDTPAQSPERPPRNDPQGPE